ncbi:MAG: hypothetical protein Q8R82_06640 [Hyphomonadaceae bacterium]|nr:hypothetical protein [Hyphomonadaceae bacterium]
MFDKPLSVLVRIYRIGRGSFDRAKWILPKTFRFLFAVGSLAVAIIAVGNSVKDGATQNEYFEAVKTTGTAISMLLGFLAILYYWFHKLTIADNSIAQQITHAVRGAEVIHTNVGQSLLTDTDANQLIETAHNPIEYNRKLSDIDEMVQLFKGMLVLRLPNANITTFDDKKIKLRTDISREALENGETIHLQQTSYFRDRLSNAVWDKLVKLDERTAINFVDETFASRFDQHSGKIVWRLHDLPQSPLANQIGASCILLTSDRRVIYLRQGRRSSENEDKLGPSGSGSFDARALTRYAGKTLQELVRGECQRELKEECGITDSDIVDIQICGFGRYLYRGGKPEFFCIATTSKGSPDIKVPVREWDFQSKLVIRSDAIAATRGPMPMFCNTLADGFDRLWQSLERNHGKEKVSGPLIWNLRLAADYLRKGNPERLRLLLKTLNPSA